MPQQIVGALGQIPRRKLMTIGGGIAIGILFLIGMVVLSGCDSKPQEQLDAEVAALQVASCPTGLAFYDELEQPICWMPGFQVYPNQTDPPCEYYGSGYIHVDLETFEPKEGPYADPPPGCVPGDEAVAQTGATVHKGADFIIVEGPRFSTKTESKVFRSWGMGLIGMTAVPEAQLAREAELAYSVMAHVTDYDVWHESEEAVTVEMVVRTLMQNVSHAKEAIRNVVPMLDGKTSPCWDALASAVMTDPTRFPSDTRERMGILLDKYYPR